MSRTGDQSNLNLHSAAAVIDVFQRAAEAMAASPLRTGSAVRIRWSEKAAQGTADAHDDDAHATPQASTSARTKAERTAKPSATADLRQAAPPTARLLATGDLHDNPMHLRKILALAQLEKSPEHHVVLHEMIHGERLINGLDFSHRMLARVAELVLAHPSQVHPLLANHELAQLTDKGISKGAGNSVEMFSDGLEYVFGDEWLEVDAAIKRFIAAMPLALISASGVLCAHSLPAPHMMAKFDASVLDRPLEADDYAAPTGSAHLMVWGRNHSPEQIEQLAAAWKVELFCLGHEHVETGAEVRGRRVLILNSDHERAAVVPIDLTKPPPSAEEALMQVIPLGALGA